MHGPMLNRRWTVLAPAAFVCFVKARPMTSTPGQSSQRLALWSLLIIRTVTMVAAALFTPQAAATIGLLVLPERRSESIAFIFIGWSMASVVGIPLGSILGTAFGWRATFFAMAILAAVSCVGVMLSLKPGLRVQPLQLSSWLAVFKNPALLCI